MSTAWIPEFRLGEVAAQLGIDIKPNIASDPPEYRLTKNDVFLFLGSPNRCSDYLTGILSVMPPVRTERTRHEASHGHSAATTSFAIRCSSCTRTLRLEHNFSSLGDLQSIQSGLLAAASELGWTIGMDDASAHCPTHRIA